MKKLGKKIDFQTESVEAYCALCTCDCWAYFRATSGLDSSSIANWGGV